MDGLKQYAAPWGYRAAERFSPGGRGWSLRVRELPGAAMGWVLGACWPMGWCWSGSRQGGQC